MVTQFQLISYHLQTDLYSMCTDRKTIIIAKHLYANIFVEKSGKAMFPENFYNTKRCNHFL